MKKLLFLPLLLTACATSMKKSVDICQNGKQTQPLLATFAVYEVAPKGIPIADLTKEQEVLNNFADYLAENFFALLSKTDISGKVYAPNLNKSMRFVDRIHIVRTSKDFDFVVCREKQCEGLIDPFHAEKVQRYHDMNKNYISSYYFYAYDWRSASVSVDKRYFIRQIYPDPFTGAIASTGINLADFMGTHYWDKNIQVNPIISKKIQGDWKIIQTKMDFKEVCHEAKSKSDLYTST
jgi:hypothetical protein